jgi:hypothetical protein
MKVAPFFAALLALSLSAAAADKSYQVTGPVVEVTDSKIVVETKDDGKWEIARSAATKTAGAIKVGDKVTVKYTMTATSIEAKGDKAEAKPEVKKEEAQKADKK